MRLKRIMSTIAATAIAVSGLAIGATSAQAAEAQLGTTITLTAPTVGQLVGHSFKALKLADLSSDANGTVDVTTVSEPEAVRAKIDAAVAESNGGDAPEYDPMAFVSGIAGNPAYTNDVDPDAAPWTGSLRDLVNDLTDDDTLKNAAQDVTPGDFKDTNGVYSAVLDVKAAGLWLIFDTTTSNASLPMLVGTSVAGAANKYTNPDTGETTDTWPSPYGGVVTIKNQEIQANGAFEFVTTNADSTQYLNGAEYQLYQGAQDTLADNAAPLKFSKGSNGVYTVATNGAVDTLTSATVDTVDGLIKVTGLTAGTYTVVQIKTVASYSAKLLAKFTVTIADDGTVTFENGTTWQSLGDKLDVDDNTETPDVQTVLNYLGVSQLPLTGGITGGVVICSIALLLSVGLVASIALAFTRRASARR